MLEKPFFKNRSASKNNMFNSKILAFKRTNENSGSFDDQQ